MRREVQADSGLVIVDKPAGLTSHDVVARIRRIAGTRKVGHAGTLDPMATGVLVVGVEKATRLLTFIVGTAKTYEATIRLGASTNTDDADGEITATADASAIDPQALADGIAALTGPIQQVPSSVSAIKVDGKRSYARVRAGEDVQLAARPVTVHSFEVLAERIQDGFHDLDVRVGCSSGTYIRALARDLGAGLGVGGHLTALRRTQVGPYGLDQAHTMAALEEPGGYSVLSLEQAAAVAFPAWQMDETVAAQVAHGQLIPAPDELGHPTEDAPAAAFAPDGTLVALVRRTRAGKVRPVIVLAAP